MELHKNKGNKSFKITKFVKFHGENKKIAHKCDLQYSKE